MDKFADLHIHSWFSDGQYSPSDIVKMAKEIGFSAISLTDHDTMRGVNQAVQMGDELGIEVIPGVEISTVFNGDEVHILAYMCDPENIKLKEKLNTMQLARKERIKKMVLKLRELNFDISYEEVSAAAGSGSIGRPHIARVLLEKGYVRTISEAFKDLLTPGCPAYIARYNITPKEAIELILQAEGVPIIAHPGLLKDDSIIPELIGYGLRGIEVWHPDHKKNTRKKYRDLAYKHGVLLTGGSDWHGKNKAAKFKLGNIKLDYEYVEKLKAEQKNIKDNS